MELDALKLKMIGLEQRLSPIADRPVDITKPGWGLRLNQHQHPLDEAGVRSDAEGLLHELIAVYRSEDDDNREAIRKLFQEHRSFAWAASLPASPTTDEGFREQLVLFSMKDQERDSRDALLTLQHLCRQARAAGVNAAPILKEVAELSSDVNKYGMGSTREMLLRLCEVEQRR
jgi:hypothetical protein